INPIQDRTTKQELKHNANMLVERTWPKTTVESNVWTSQKTLIAESLKVCFTVLGPRGNLWARLLATGSRTWGIDRALIQPELE
ncbi:MAG: hypothetical protein NT090_25595, partial [Acidobacteria bacterium]|nr:hypothetical protein [Acidobacteriota bacterium]